MSVLVRIAQANSKCCKLKLTSHPLPPHGAIDPNGPGPPHYRGLTITLRHTTDGRILWTSDHPTAETFVAADPRLRP